MLDNTTKRKIDSARQILVGKVPDPKAQVEQITTALVYKFMDDMDKEAIELGGEARFFANEFSQYSWTKLMDNRLSGQERLELYAEAIANMSKNPHIPQLFRDIFKGAFLPFRDPRTLNLFLKEINEFNYDHSENLGNAFEYLLSILGSQGDAGQFRTPRHIIDFIVEVVNPQKNETILDPACGTAGFLISAYKHILKTNSSNFKTEEKAEDKIIQGETALETIIQEKQNYRGDLLSPDNRTKITQNIAGYDISPDMVKLALVNLYLHGFSDPKIFEYDALSSDKRWDENFDVILANPPFMTPKGGIVPHKRFSIQANRAEVLFVDYIAEHLSIKGRAGIIVPEGIIFQSANAYKNLRKNLIENWGLYAVVSLPSGVFQPYSGVKTSILLLDREFAKRTDEILFLKVENDGFDLGAQRRKINKNDLPKALEVLERFKKKKYLSLGDLEDYGSMAFSALKSKIAENGDYNLTGERYKIDLSESLKANFETIAKALEPHQKIFKELAEHHQKQAEQIQNMVKPVLDQFNKQQEFIKEAFESIQAPIQQMQEAFNNLNYPHLLELAQKAIKEINTNKWPMVELGEVCEILDNLRKPITKSDRISGDYPYYGATGILDYVQDYIFDEKLVLIGEDGAKWDKGDKTAFIATGKYWVNNHAHVLRPDRSKLLDELLVELINSMDLSKYITGITVPKLNQGALRSIQIPLPPLEVQEQIVAEIEQYQKVINGARQVVENWKPSFRIDPSWEMVELGEVCDVGSSKRVFQSEWKKEGIPFYRAREIVKLAKNGFVDNELFITNEMFEEYSKKYGIPKEGDLMVTGVGTLGVSYLVQKSDKFYFKDGNLIWFKNFKENVNSRFIKLLYDTDLIQNQIKGFSAGGTVGTYTITNANKTKIPLPPLEVQEQIVAEIEAEQKIVNANKELMEKMQKKIEAKIGEVWGEEPEN